MTEQKAKEVIRTPGYPNVMEVLEALEVAESILGPDIKMTDVYKWAEGDDETIDTVAVH